MILLAPSVPLRLAIGIGACCVLAVMSYVAAYGWDLEQPLPPWRRKVVVASRHCAGVVVVMLGFRVRVKGWENIAAGHKIGIFNHISWVDACLLMWLFAPSGVSLESNASAADERFPMLFMAPEGTCGDGRGILTFRSGAFLSGVPVLPVAFRYNIAHHNPAWTIINEGFHALRMMCQLENWVEVTILPPYIPSTEEKADKALYAANVRQLYCDTLQLPPVPQGVAHYVALTKAKVCVSWDGYKVVAPPGVVDENGFADLTLWGSNGKKQS